ncbi:MAG: glycine dehydrogenase, partial [Candidatus Marinimicrobia bacterium]|nr:glycine dehydrogenase [Candidatus Neomarinimicrobiota bacterium]
MHYIPTTEAEEKDILKQSGIENFDELISVIPSHLQIREKIGIGYPLSEIDIEEELKTLSAINQSDNVCFIGGGIYDHFIP